MSTQSTPALTPSIPGAPAAPAANVRAANMVWASQRVDHQLYGSLATLLRHGINGDIILAIGSTQIAATDLIHFAKTIQREQKEDTNEILESLECLQSVPQGELFAALNVLVPGKNDRGRRHTANSYLAAPTASSSASRSTSRRRDHDEISTTDSTVPTEALEGPELHADKKQRPAGKTTASKPRAGKKPFAGKTTPPNVGGRCCPMCEQTFFKPGWLPGHVEKKHVEEMVGRIPVKENDRIGCGYCRSDGTLDGQNHAFSGPKELVEHVLHVHSSSDNQQSRLGTVSFDSLMANTLSGVPAVRTGCRELIAKETDKRKAQKGTKLMLVLRWASSKTTIDLLEELRSFGGTLCSGNIGNAIFNQSVPSTQLSAKERAKIKELSTRAFEAADITERLLESAPETMIQAESTPRPGANVQMALTGITGGFSDVQDFQLPTPGAAPDPFDSNIYGVQGTQTSARDPGAAPTLDAQHGGNALNGSMGPPSRVLQQYQNQAGRSTQQIISRHVGKDASSVDQHHHSAQRGYGPQPAEAYDGISGHMHPRGAHPVTSERFHYPGAHTMVTGNLPPSGANPLMPGHSTPLSAYQTSPERAHPRAYSMPPGQLHPHAKSIPGAMSPGDAYNSKRHRQPFNDYPNQPPVQGSLGVAYQQKNSETPGIGLRQGLSPRTNSSQLLAQAMQWQYHTPNAPIEVYQQRNTETEQSMLPTGTSAMSPVFSNWMDHRVLNEWDNEDADPLQNPGEGSYADPTRQPQ